MEIISKHTSGDEWSKVARCRECKAELRVFKSDIKAVNTAVAYGGETWEPELRYQCAVCSSWNDIKAPSGITEEKEQELRKRERR